MTVKHQELSSTADSLTSRLMDLEAFTVPRVTALESFDLPERVAALESATHGPQRNPSQDPRTFPHDPGRSVPPPYNAYGRQPPPRYGSNFSRQHEYRPCDIRTIGYANYTAS